MPGRSIYIEVRVRVIGMLENGAKANQAAVRAGVHRATVFRIKSKFLQTGSVKNRSTSSRLKSTTAVQDRFLRLTTLSSGLNGLLNLLPTFDGLQEWLAIYPRTVRNRLKSVGIVGASVMFLQL